MPWIRTAAPDLGNAAAATALVVMWSSGFIGAELGTSAAPADTLLAWRYVLAATILGVWAGWRGIRVSRRVLRRQAVLGLLCQTMYLGGVVTGVGLGVPAGTAALIAALQPLVVGALVGPMLGESVSVRQRVGLALGLVGVALVIGPGLGVGGPGWAYLLPVGGMLALSVGTVLERRWRPSESLLESLTVQTVLTAGAFVGLAAVTGRLAPPEDSSFWLAVAWVVALSTFGGYGSYLLVLRRQGASRVSSLLYLTPPTTMLWALLMFSEVPPLITVPGFALCALGVYLSIVTPSRFERQPSPTRILSGDRTPALELVEQDQLLERVDSGRGVVGSGAGRTARESPRG